MNPQSPESGETKSQSNSTAETLESGFRALRQSRLRVEGAIEASGLILREWDTASDESI